MNDFLVDADWLKSHAADALLIDTRGRDEYWAGHLPGARHFDPFPFHYYDTSAKAIGEFNAQMEWVFSTLGVSRDANLVFYEGNSGMRATRGAWIAEYLGHPAVRILDGGLKADVGAPLTTAAPSVAAVAFKAQPRPEILATAADVSAALARGDTRIFDVRTEAEYYGEQVRAKRGGAIPRAVHRDWILNNDTDGRFRKPAELREIFAQLGLSDRDPVIAYCQGGYRAAHAYYALRLAGYGDVRNYLGSWGEWGNREDLPIETPRRPA